MSKARLKEGGWQIGTDTVDATAAEIDASAGTGISQAELAVLNAVTPGTVAASKALVVDANKDLATLRHVTLSGNLVAGSTTLSEAELGVLDAVTAGAAAASKACVLDANLDLASIRHLTLSGNLVTSANVGSAGVGTTAVEEGNSAHHRTTLTVAGTLPAIAGGAALAVGLALYTFPAGVIQVHGSYMTLAITQSEGNITADQPDGGLGTGLASGANATLDAAGAGAENLLTGQTFDDCNGTAEVKSIATALAIESGDSHIVYFNVADTWAASGDAAATLAGTAVLDWSFLA